MYAVVNTGGKQAKVSEGDIIAIEKLDAKVGQTVTLPVLFIADGDRVMATPAELEGAGVTAEVLEHFKGEKVIVFKFKKRKGYKRTQGHRQSLTSVRILSIVTSGAAAPKPKAAKADKPAEPKAVKSEKPAEKKAPKAEADAVEKPVEAPVAAPEKKAPKAAPKAAKADAVTETAQCEAVKSDGTRCANKAKEGSKYCGVHAKKLEG